ncbi:MAG TPA: hypothetical protein VGL08_13815 [Paraburkholderia sp.]
MFRTAALHRFASLPTLGSVAAIALFVAVLAWWAHVFYAPEPAAAVRPAPPAAIDASAGATLFGSQPDHGAHDAVQLLGVLSFDAHHGAAIVSVGGEPARVVNLNGHLTDSATLAEVRARSIVVKANGLQREIMLPAAENPSAFVR